MADKYAHLAPKHTRSCRRADGIAKRPLDEAQAIEAAEQLNAKPGNPIVHAYRCPECGWWHTGRDRAADPSSHGLFA